MYGAVLVLEMVACGCCAVAAWDMIAALRSAWGIRGVVGGIVDFLSPAAFAAVIWLGVLFVMDGSTRVYVFLCMGAGAVLYILTVRVWICKLFCVVFGNIRKIIGFIFKILLTPARFLYKMIYVELYAKRRSVSAETEKTADDPKD